MSLQDVQRKARFGHRDWLFWRDAEGQPHAVYQTAETMKRCLLDCRFKRTWVLVLANTGHCMQGFWSLGIIQLRQLKLGYK